MRQFVTRKKIFHLKDDFFSNRDLYYRALIVSKSEFNIVKGIPNIWWEQKPMKMRSIKKTL